MYPRVNDSHMAHTSSHIHHHSHSVGPGLAAPKSIQEEQDDVCSHSLVGLNVTLLSHQYSQQSGLFTP